MAYPLFSISGIGVEENTTGQSLKSTKTYRVFESQTKLFLLTFISRGGSRGGSRGSSEPPLAGESLCTTTPPVEKHQN